MRGCHLSQTLGVFTRELGKAQVDIDVLKWFSRVAGMAEAFVAVQSGLWMKYVGFSK